MAAGESGARDDEDGMEPWYNSSKAVEHRQARQGPMRAKGIEDGGAAAGEQFSSQKSWSGASDGNPGRQQGIPLSGVPEQADRFVRNQAIGNLKNDEQRKTEASTRHVRARATSAPTAGIPSAAQIRKGHSGRSQEVT
jgi:hypothetical protein